MRRLRPLSGNTLPCGTSCQAPAVRGIGAAVSTGADSGRRPRVDSRATGPRLEMVAVAGLLYYLPRREHPGLESADCESARIDEVLLVRALKPMTITQVVSWLRTGPSGR